MRPKQRGQELTSLSDAEFKYKLLKAMPLIYSSLVLTILLAGALAKVHDY